MHKSKQAEVWRLCRSASCTWLPKGRKQLLLLAVPMHHRAAIQPAPPPHLPLQRFISRKTVDKVLKELREAAGGGSRPGSRAASGSFSGSLSAGHSGLSGSGLAGGGVRPSGSVTAERR